MENFERGLQLINLYGFPLVALALIIVWLRPKLDQIWNGYIKKSTEAPSNLEDVLKIDFDISDLLTEILISFKCSYVTIWQFHNGGSSLAGIPFLRVTATHQKSADNGPLYAGRYQGVPVSLMFDKNTTQLFKSITSGDETSFPGAGVRALMHEQGLKVLHVAPIRDHHGVLVGYVSLAYKESVELDICQVNQLESFASRLMILLALQAKTSKRFLRK